MDASGMIPVSVVSGFLGSGKTTLIGRLLRDPRYARTAVIVNEFGEIGLDHELIASADETMIELTTGCLCCAVRSDLVETLLLMGRRRKAGEVTFERVVIETSGLADPAPILHALMTDAAICEAFALAGLVTLIDAVHGAATLAGHAEARRQAAMADRILFSKTDVVAVSEKLREVVASLNRTASTFAAAPHPALLFDDLARTAFGFSSLAAHGGRAESCVIRRHAPVPALALTLLLQALAEHCGSRLLRLKGLVNVAEMPGRPAVVHAVQHVVAPVAFLERWPNDDHDTRIVVIGEGIPRYFPARLLDAIIAEVACETMRQGGGRTPAAFVRSAPSKAG